MKKKILKIRQENGLDWTTTEVEWEELEQNGYVATTNDKGWKVILMTYEKEKK